MGLMWEFWQAELRKDSKARGNRSLKVAVYETFAETMLNQYGIIMNKNKSTVNKILSEEKAVLFILRHA